MCSVRMLWVYLYVIFCVYSLAALVASSSHVLSLCLCLSLFRLRYVKLHNAWDGVRERVSEGFVDECLLPTVRFSTYVVCSWLTPSLWERGIYSYLYIIHTCFFQSYFRAKSDVYELLSSLSACYFLKSKKIASYSPSFLAFHSIWASERNAHNIHTTHIQTDNITGNNSWRGPRPASASGRKIRTMYERNGVEPPIWWNISLSLITKQLVHCTHTHLPKIPQTKPGKGSV